MQKPLTFLCAPLLLCAALLQAQSPDVQKPVRERNWEEILGRSQAALPRPRPATRWFENFAEAKAVAAREGRPLFVVMRCLPCKQCADFDAAVLEGGPTLDPLLRQFVCVRLTSVQSVDLNQFPMQSMQDLDLSWWGWFLSPEGSIYSVFGGKDEHGDSSRISPPALAATLKRVLEHHFDPRRADWDVDVKPTRAEIARTPFDLPGFAAWGRSLTDPKEIACLHCHQVAEILRQPAIDAKTFDKQRDLQLWPYPENIGIEVQRDDGLLITKVTEGGPAAKAGLVPGDRLAGAGEKKLFGQTDLRVALQRIGAEGGKLELRWKRARQLMEATLELQPGWKRVVLDWRQSVAAGNIGAHPGFAWPNEVNDADKLKLQISQSKLAVKPYFGPNKDAWVARKAGLIESDVILAVNGQSPNLSGRAFLVWFRGMFEPGDDVVLTVRSAKGGEREVKYKTTARGR